jgi:RNA 3'-terminal phosphate cyclase (ATP)
MTDWITIDGSAGEGGGQMLRTALALSLVTGRPFRIERIRAGREKPGLLRQHLTAVHAAAAVGRAAVTGGELGSTALTFEPSAIEGGEYRWTVGTAGSATLVLQAVLPALIVAKAPSTLTLEGGTHNPFAPPYDFLARTFVPALRRMGATIDTAIDRYGFYPAGGGCYRVSIVPAPSLEPIALLERGDVRVRARALVSALPEEIAKRELTIVRERLGLDRESCHVETVDSSIGPGNILFIAIEGEPVTEIVTGFGEKQVSAEQVAARACAEARALLAAGVPVGPYLADQLLIPMALAGGGAFRTLAPSRHTVTNARVIRQFIDVPIAFDREADTVYRVSIGAHAPGRVS